MEKYLANYQSVLSVLFYDKIRRDNLQVYICIWYICTLFKKNDSVALVEKPTTTRTSLLAVDS